MAVFALLFGSELFEDYIGHLAVASMASSELAINCDRPEKLHDKLKASSLRYNRQNMVHNVFYYRYIVFKINNIMLRGILLLVEDP